MTKKANKAKAIAGTDIIGAMDGPFADWFHGPSWSRWRAILKGAYALEMTQAERDLFEEVAEREPPAQRVRELWVVGGRRGGKDSVASLIIAYAAAVFDGKRRQFAGITLPPLRKGERGTIFCLARDRDQAAIALNYVRSYFEDIPELAAMVVRQTRHGLELVNGVDIVVAANDFRGIRGRAVLCAVLDEVAFFKDENSSSPDVELYNALEPGTKTLIDQAMIVGISSAHKKSGLLYSKFVQSYGKNDPKVLVVRATSLQLNPTLPADEIAAEIAADPELKRAEYECVWRTDISSFIGPEIVDAAIMKGRQVLAPSGESYVAFTDVSGGVRDAHSLGVSFQDNATGHAMLACAREIKSADTEAVVSEFAAILKSYGLTYVYGDRYGAQWVADAFKRHGIDLRKSLHDRSGLYLNLLPMLNSGQARLLDLPRIRSQLLALERRTIRGTGRDVVDHPQAGADDLINSVAGSLVLSIANAGRTFCAIDAGGRMISIVGGVTTVTQLDDAGGVVGEPLVVPKEDEMLSHLDRSRRAALGKDWRSLIPPSDPSYRKKDTPQ